MPHLPPEPTDPFEETPPEPPGLMRASDLVTDEEDLDAGDYEPVPGGTLYKGFRVCTGGDIPVVKAHAHLRGRFYVESPEGSAGLVPWDGSQIIWPWEAAWAQDLHRTSVETFLKEEPKKKERK